MRCDVEQLQGREEADSYLGSAVRIPFVIMALYGRNNRSTNGCVVSLCIVTPDHQWMEKQLGSVGWPISMYSLLFKLDGSEGDSACLQLTWPR